MSAPNTWAELARALRSDPLFRRAHTRELARAPHEAFVWETVPVSSDTRDRSFAQIVAESPGLARARPDPRPFAEHFGRARAGICVFTNLGGDATLIAPAPRGPPEHYTHLAAFLRGAASDQVDALWIAVGRAVEEHWTRSAAPVWVSTAGLGVHWLHVRLDARPKYYRHDPFRRFSRGS